MFYFSKVLAVLDWELSTLGKDCFYFFIAKLLFTYIYNFFLPGDPLSDIAYMCLAHHIPVPKDSPMLR